MSQEAPIERVERQLAAILAADIVGFSRHMGENDVATVRRLDDLRARIIDPAFAEFGGRLVKSMGDGLLVEFASAPDAVDCAIAVQARIGADNAAAAGVPLLVFRIGVHIADVIREGDDIFGDGVNIAARLQAIAEPGGLCASATVVATLARDRQVPFEDRGSQDLRNILRPVHVYALGSERIAGLAPALARAAAPGSRPATRRAPASLAVLPFRAADGEDTYFADGVVEDIIGSLSLFRFLTVIARNSSFVFRSRPADLRQIARQLGVRYLADGSIRRAGNKVRASVELIDGATAATLWAGQFAADAADIFDLQDDITRRIVTAIEPRVLEAEIEASRRKPAASLGAYDYYLRALALRPVLSAEATFEALRLARKATQLDANYGPALSLVAISLGKLRDQGYAVLTAEEVADGLHCARRAIEIEPNNPAILCQAGHTIQSLAGDTGHALSLIEKATALNANLAEAWARSAWLHLASGHLEKAISDGELAIRLSPLDPSNFVPYSAIGYAHLFAGRFEEAETWARKTLAGLARPEMAHRLLVVAQSARGNEAAARAAAAEFIAEFPQFRTSEWARRTAFTKPDQQNTVLEHLKRAGLPD